MTKNRQELIALAKLAENTERYSDMVQMMKKIVDICPELTHEERNLLSIAYKNLMGPLRVSWRTISKEASKLDNSKKKITEEYRSEVESEFRRICNEVLSMLDKHLVPNAKVADAKVFYLKMMGDYSRYLAEISSENTRKEVLEKSQQAYLEAFDLAKNDLSSTHPCRLGVALNFSVFYYEILDDKEKACQIAKKDNKMGFRINRFIRYVPRKFFLVFLYALVLFGLFTIYRSSSSRTVETRQEVVKRDIPEGIKVDRNDPFTEYKNLQKKDWHDYEAMKSDESRSGPGEHGTPVVVADDEITKKKQDELYRVNGYNAYVSDQIALNRSIKDIRHKGCRDIKYIEKLPSVSVIFPFHNEHNSTLLRSAYSVINRSPPGVVREIILVDDASTKEALKKPLEEFLKENNMDHIVKVVRTSKREGLIRARQIGAQAATGDILIFLDAHSEANYNWLPPLIEPIAMDYRTVVCPFVDVIDCDTFELRPQDEGARGSFDWEFNYKRLPLTDEDNRHPTRPFKSPVMAGGYFAISSKWFWELGGYDEGLDIWGGEQVGHIYRCKYVPFPNPGVGDFISRNYKRVAEVWMDEYKEHLYKRRPSMRSTETGDLSKQMAVRDRLKCKSFDWFMKEVAFDQDRFYPAVEPPDGGNGELRNLAADKCVDTQFKGTGERFELRKCISDDPSGGGEQNMRMSFWEDIRPMGRTMCFDVSTSVKQAPVVLFSCHGMKGNQLFKYRLGTRQLYHPVSNQCLDCDPERGEIFMNPCDATKTSQKWQFKNLDEKVVEERNKKER